MYSPVHFKFSRIDEKTKKTFVEEYIHFDEVCTRMKVISSNVLLIKIITDEESDRGVMEKMDLIGF